MSTTSDEYLDWLRELLAPLGRIGIRRMFDGAGVQVDGHMIAIVVDETLWFKVDDGNRAEFESLDLPRFHYERLGKTVAMNFYQPPEEALDSPREMLRWARSALGASLRSGAVATQKANPAKTARVKRSKPRCTPFASMRWAVEIQRTSLTRRNLEDLLTGLGYKLIDGAPFPAITSPEMDQCQTASQAIELGWKVRNAFAGPARIDPELSTGSVIDYSTSPPRRHAFLEAQSSVHAVTFAEATLTVNPPAGLSPAALDAWQKERAEQEYQSRLSAQRATLEPAYREPRAAKVLEYLAVHSPSAEVLNKIYELIEGHPNNRAAFQNQLGISRDDFNRFRDAVHNPAVSGDWARHAYQDAPRTTNPMSRREAEEFIRGIARRWLASLANKAPQTN